MDKNNISVFLLPNNNTDMVHVFGAIVPFKEYYITFADVLRIDISESLRFILGGGSFGQVFVRKCLNN